MPSWNDLLTELEAQPNDAAKSAWLNGKIQLTLEEIRKRRGGRNVLFYGSAFLQKPFVPAPFLQLTHDEINGFMACIYGMKWDEGLTLILHTPGGITNAAETIVAYLISKFKYIEVIIPTFAMSAGTMIALSSNRLIMGRQSQLGPIDPQMPFSKNYVSARAIVDQFERAKAEILANRDLAHVWAPILQSLGPSLLMEAQNALDYGEGMVAQWLENRMFSKQPDAKTKAIKAAHFFSDATSHKSHGRRIDRDEARTQDIVIDDLEDDQLLQEAVLTAYHLLTIIFEKGPASKVLMSHHRRQWVKNVNISPVGPSGP